MAQNLIHNSIKSQFSPWQADLIAALHALNLKVEYLRASPQACIKINNQLYVYLDTLYLVLPFTITYKSKLGPWPTPPHGIHIWEDVYLHNPAAVLGRLKSLLGSNARIYARTCEVRPIEKWEAQVFLTQQHMQGSTRSKYNLGLFYKDKLMAVASFGPLRKKLDSPGYISGELIRLSSLQGYTIVGGFSKLLRHFMDLYQPHDLMTYCDLDWSTGAVYEKLGFKHCGRTPALSFRIQADGTRVKFNPLKTGADEVFKAAFNSGNIKYKWYV